MDLPGYLNLYFPIPYPLIPNPSFTADLHDWAAIVNRADLQSEPQLYLCLPALQKYLEVG